eukprot:2029256-Ditylum_brightwellii.AAC.1
MATPFVTKLFTLTISLSTTITGEKKSDHTVLNDDSNSKLMDESIMMGEAAPLESSILITAMARCLVPAKKKLGIYCNNGPTYRMKDHPEV